MNTSFFKDLAERAVSTYVEAVAGLLIASNTFAASGINITALESAAVAAIPASLSVIKSLVAAQVGDTGTAALVSTPVTPDVVNAVIEKVAAQLIAAAPAGPAANVVNQVVQAELPAVETTVDAQVAAAQAAAPKPPESADVTPVAPALVAPAVPPVEATPPDAPAAA